MIPSANYEKTRSSSRASVSKVGCDMWKSGCSTHRRNDKGIGRRNAREHERIGKEGAAKHGIGRVWWLLEELSKEMR